MRWSYVIVHRYFVYVKSSKTLKRMNVLDGWSQESREGGKAHWTNLCALQLYPELGVLKLTQRGFDCDSSRGQSKPVAFYWVCCYRVGTKTIHTATGSLDSTLYLEAHYLHYLVSLILLLSNNWCGPQELKNPFQSLFTLWTPCRQKWQKFLMIYILSF